jgi:hypothetical protein
MASGSELHLSEFPELHSCWGQLNARSGFGLGSRHTGEDAVMTRGTIVWASGIVTAAACALIGAGIFYAGGHAERPAHLAARSETWALLAGKGGTPPPAEPLQPGEIRYASEGVSILPAAADAHPVHSEADALAAFDAQPSVINQFAQNIASLQPDVQLMHVTDTQPVDGNPPPEEYLGWVIIYHSVPPAFYGGVGSSPPPDGSNMTCDLVGIQNAQTGEWTETFESCS